MLSLGTSLVCEFIQYSPYNAPDQAPRTFQVRLQAQLKDSVIFMLLLTFYAKGDYFVCICKGSEFQPKYECSSLKRLLWLLFVSTSAQPSREWELMYDSKGTGTGFIVLSEVLYVGYSLPA